jgi:glutamate dehydrogenase
MVNRMGATFTLRMQEDTGRSAAEVAKAYSISREALDARDLWARIDALDGKVSELAQIDALKVIWHLLRSMSRWLLSRPGAIPEITDAMARYGAGLKAVQAALPSSMSSVRREAFEHRQADWKSKGFPAALAEQLAALPLLEFGCDIVEIANARRMPPAEVTDAYFALGAALHMPWLYEQIEALEVDGRWQALARGALRDELAIQQRALVGQILASGSTSHPARDKVDAWLQRDDASLRFTQAMFADLLSQKTIDYPTASVAVRRLAQVAGAGG